MMYCVKKFSLACAALCLTMLLACGNESTTEVTGQSGVAMLEAGKSLPGCDSTNAGDMVYVADSAAVYYCADGKWQKLNGKDGERGDVGAKGENGEKGDAGAEGKTPEVRDGTGCTVGDPFTDKDGNTVIAVACGETIRTLTIAKGDLGDTGAGCSIGEPSTDKDGNTTVAVICGETTRTLTIAKGDLGDTGAGCTVGEPSTDKEGNTVVAVTCGETIRTLTIAKGDPGDIGAGCTIGEPSVNKEGNTVVAVTCDKITEFLTIAKGDQGEAGVGCTAEDQGKGKIVVTCGEGESKTVQTLYKAMCGSENYYDPTEAFCFEDEVYDLCKAQTYNPATQYCLTLEGENGVKKETIEGLLIDYRNKDNVQVYKTVKIGNQVWMAENLNYAPKNVSSMGEGAWSGCYDGMDENCSKYGRLYTWEFAMDNADCAYDKTCDASLNPATPVRGICPQGWHLPSHYEFEELINHIDPNFGYNHNGNASSSTAGMYLKSKFGWESDGGTDSYGFSALPGGRRNSDCSFNNADYKHAYFWSSGELPGMSNSIRAAFVLDLVNGVNGERVNLFASNKNTANSVRCLKD